MQQHCMTSSQRVQASICEWLRTFQVVHASSLEEAVREKATQESNMKN